MGFFSNWPGEKRGITPPKKIGNARFQDRFYLSWASDGNLYSPWTDGTTDGIKCGSGDKLKRGGSTGHAVIYSANFSPGWNGTELKFNPLGGRYGWCLHEVKLLGTNESNPPADNPVRGKSE